MRGDRREPLRNPGDAFVELRAEKIRQSLLESATPNRDSDCRCPSIDQQRADYYQEEEVSR
jgi:hypothetical protein